MSTRNELVNNLKESFDRYLEALNQLDTEQLASADLGDGWTPLTLTAHVAFWDTFQRRRMQAARSGESAADGFPRDGLSNEERRAVAAAGEWPATFEGALNAREQLVDFIAGLRDEELAASYPEGRSVLYLGGLARHMVRHAEEHTEQLSRYIERVRQDRT